MISNQFLVISFLSALRRNSVHAVIRSYSAIDEIYGPAKTRPTMGAKKATTPTK